MSNKINRGRPSHSQVIKQFVSAIGILDKFGGLPDNKTAKQIWNDIWHLEAHNSTAIEGNTLVLSEVRALLEQNRTIGRKELKEYLEVKGYAKAALWVYSQARRDDIEFNSSNIISLSEIRYIHEMLLKDVWSMYPHKDQLPNEDVGNFRLHDINPFFGGMKPPPFTDIAPQMGTFVDECNYIGDMTLKGELDTEDIPTHLAKLHCIFETIHPFLDGNGRTGRLVLNLLLVRLGIPPAIILKNRRESYLQALDNADKGNLTPLATIIAKAVIDNINRFIAPNLAKPENLVPLKSLETKEIKYQMLRQAAARGRLKATIGIDGIWYSSKSSLEKYLKSKYRR